MHIFDAADRAAMMDAIEGIAAWVEPTCFYDGDVENGPNLAFNPPLIDDLEDLCAGISHIGGDVNAYRRHMDGFLWVRGAIETNAA